MTMQSQTMRRRTFLAGAAASMLGLRLGLRPDAVMAQDSGDYQGPFWIFVHASGGFDPQFLFNPTDRPLHNRLYTDIGKVGNIPYAGWTVAPGTMGLAADFDPTGIVYSPRTFLEGYPALGAMVAKEGGSQMPLAFLAGGGYDATLGLVPAVRLSNVDTIERIAEPNVMRAGDEAGYHSGPTWDRIRKLQEARLARLSAAQGLPTLRRAMLGLSSVRAGGSALARLALPEPVNFGGGLGALSGAARQAQLAVAAFKAGLAISAGLRVGGFDTHGNHDQNQPRQLMQLLGAVGFALDEAERAGLKDRTYVLVTSDFGRGPYYNGEGNGSGKDHWPITSMLAFGPKIAGNRVIGDTDDDQRALAVDPDTLALNRDGVVLSPEHVHRALRKLAGIAGGELDRDFPISGESLPLFG
jgi:uncharacterized protein (DUF1501 family)